MHEPSSSPALERDGLLRLAGAERGATRLLGRRGECEVLDRLVADADAGSGRVLVLRGDAGVGKSALLEYLSGRTANWRVTSAVGVESEIELAYSGLHQLCAPLLEHLEQLPAPQRDALTIVFGLRPGPPPDRFLVGLATLTLIAEAAEDQPLACLVDDAQWLDSASAQILTFVARRLLAERVVLVCAARRGGGDDVLAGLPALEIRALGDDDARALLLAHLPGPMDTAVIDRIVAESHGNPLALLELPRTWRRADLAGGFGLLDADGVVGKIEESFVRRLVRLPPETQLLVLTAAAEPVGDPGLLSGTGRRLGVGMGAVVPAVDAGLLQVRARVEFAHPLLRSAAYRTASTADRYRVHAALAEVTDAEADPDRRAWHRAHATPGPDEDVAADLERSAGRAQARGGMAAAAAFLRRSADLTEDPRLRADRALAAAHASLQAGAFDAALELVARADAMPLDDAQHARGVLVRAHVAFARGLGREGPPLLLRAARLLEPLDLALARETYLIAWVSAVFAGHHPGGNDALEISRAVRALPHPAGPPRALDMLLDGLALLTIDGHAAAAPQLRRAATVLTDLPLDDVLRWGWMATAASDAMWDAESTRAIAQRNVELIRGAGALAKLPLPLAQLGNVAMWSGDFARTASTIAEAESLAAATGSEISPNTPLRLLALQGRHAEASARIARTLEHAAVEGQAMATVCAHWAAAVLCNGLARYEEAMAAARRATADPFEPFVSMQALPELVEAAARAGDRQLARDALTRLVETTQPSGTDFALGIEARCRALLADAGSADELYREATDRLARAGIRPELGRGHLLYGEWLSGQGRRLDARDQLTTAYEMFTTMGMQGFAERARRELLTVGATVHRNVAESSDDLTTQEAHIARLAAEGRSNPEIGEQLFLSPRTVEWHLRKVFTKLGISSRRQLRGALSHHGLQSAGS